MSYSNKEKKIRVTQALQQDSTKNLSDGYIAKMCDVSQPFVSKIRKKLQLDGLEFQTVRQGLDGRIITTSNIGVGNDYSKRIIENFRTRINPNKQFVEDTFLNMISLYNKKCRCLVITGPDYKRHINKLFGIIASYVFVVEVNKNICASIWQQALSCNYFNKDLVNIIHGNIEDIIINDCSYIDLDLMETYKNLDSILEKQLSYQKRDKQYLKFFSFTSSLRGSGGMDECFSWFSSFIEKMLDCYLYGFDGVMNGFGKGISMNQSQGKKPTFCCRHIPAVYKGSSGRVTEIVWFNYSDGTPMMSVLIIYR